MVDPKLIEVESLINEKGSFTVTGGTNGTAGTTSQVQLYSITIRYEFLKLDRINTSLSM